MKGYKGFEKGLICKGKQYQENTVFEEKEAVICHSGMHFCENPFDVLDYYDMVNVNGEMNEFAEVEALDEVHTDDHKKYCTKKLKVGAKLSFGGFVKACVDFIFEKTQVSEDEKEESGDSSQMASSGYYSQMASSGYSSKMASSGDSSKMASSGNYSQMASSGDSSKMASSGNSSQMASSGNYSQMASSGDSSKMASSGNYSQMASSGYSSQMASSGYSSKMASSGYSSKMASSGEDSVICCAGHNAIAKAKKGSWITLSEWEYSEEKERYVPICVKTEQIDGERIKEDTFYKLVNGEFKEVKADE